MQGTDSAPAHNSGMSPKPRTTELTLNVHSVPSNDGEGPNSSPIAVDLSSFGGDFPGAQLTSLPPLHSTPSPYSSPPASPRHTRDASKNFLSNFKNRISPEQEREQGRHAKEAEDDAYQPGTSSMSKIYHLKKNPGSTPELSLVGSAENVGKIAGEGEFVRVSFESELSCARGLRVWPFAQASAATSHPPRDLHKAGLHLPPFTLTPTERHCFHTLTTLSRSEDDELLLLRRH